MEITLLSIEEYETLCERIPHLNCWWWLRSPGYDQRRATYVYGGNDIVYGDYVDNDSYAVRPALKSDWIFKDIEIGSKINAYGNTWTVISDELALSDYIINFRRFDGESNNYEESEIKQYLEEWLDEKERETLYD